MAVKRVGCEVFFSQAFSSTPGHRTLCDYVLAGWLAAQGCRCIDGGRRGWWIAYVAWYVCVYGRKSIFPSFL